MKFYLGLHQPSDAEKTRHPVFISVARLLTRRKPVDHDEWMVDSGGFTMISKHGRYTISEEQYLECVRRHNPAIAFCQDWMCEAVILKKTGLTIEEHQRRTLRSYLSLSEKDARIRPVLQGWTLVDYWRHIEMYEKAGVDLTQLFGVGTVCSRNGDPLTIFGIMFGIKLASPKMQLHGFGVKTAALAACSELLSSADSMAWSSRGRRAKLCSWCDKGSCANCLEFALLWRKKVLSQIKKEEDNARRRLLQHHRGMDRHRAKESHL